MAQSSYNHPLIHKGTNQTERIAKELLPQSLQLQEQTTAELLNFAFEYATLLRYFGEENQPDGNWQCFFGDSAAGILAIISSIDLKAIDEKYRRTEVSFWRRLKRAKEENKPKRMEKIRSVYYQKLIDEIYRLASKVNQLCEHIPPQVPLKQEAIDIIDDEIVHAVFENQIQNGLRKLIAYDKGCQASDEKGDSGTTEEKYAAFIAYQKSDPACRQIWNIDGTYAFDCISPENGYKEGRTDGECKENVNLRALFLLFFQALSKIVQRAGIHLQTELGKNNAQKPHISLFLAFVQLFKLLQKQFNRLTTLHLEYYYREVLGLDFRPFRADEVYAVFELAKNFDSFPLKKDTLLDALKDDQANPMQYVLKQEIIINKTSVDTKGLVVVDANAGGSIQMLAKPFLPEQAEAITWPLSATEENQAEVGLILEDPIFKLAEGNRFVVVRLRLKPLPTTRQRARSRSVSKSRTAVAPQNVTDRFRIFFSSSGEANGWLAIPAHAGNELNSFTVPERISGSGLPVNNYTLVTKHGFRATLYEGEKLEFRILLKPDNSPIDLPSAPEHLFSRSLAPLLKITFNPDEIGQVLVPIVKDQMQIHNIQIRADVDGVQKNITFRNENGTFNNGEPFTLLGAGKTIIEKDAGTDKVTVVHKVDKGAFLQIQAAETTGKQLTGLGLSAEATIVSDTQKLPDKFFSYFKPEFQTVNEIVTKDTDVYFPELPDVVGTLTPGADDDLVVADVLSRILKESWAKRPVPPFKGDAIQDMDQVFKQADEILTKFSPNHLLPDDVKTILTNLLTIPNSPPLAKDEVNTIFQYVQNAWSARQQTTGNEVNDIDALLVGVKDKFNFTGQLELAARGFIQHVIRRPAAVYKPMARSLAKTAKTSGKALSRYDSGRNQNILTLTLETPDSTAGLDKPQTVKNLPVHYSAYADLISTDAETGRVDIKSDLKCYYLTPFGYRLVSPPDDENWGTNFFWTADILPEANLPQPELAGSNLANLLIGLKDLTPGQGLSLLFKVTEGSGNTFFEPPTVYWSYLTTSALTGLEEWKTFRAEDITLDTTKTDPKSQNSLIQTGIVRFNTPKTMYKGGTSSFPDKNLHWIRATAVAEKDLNNNINEDIATLPQIAAIHAQAALAVFKNNGNSLTHLDTVLPADTIQKLVKPEVAIKTVSQPFTSFNGRLPEKGNEFYRRVSERLRHKDRAVTLWDFERLILEEFPEIRHAKCITHTSKQSEIDPGNVMIAVFPDLRDRNDFLAETPGVGIGLLEKVEDFLRKRASLFLYCDEHIQVVNPVYELLKVRCCIKFQPERSPHYYVSELNKDLKGFLAPWLFNKDAIPHFKNRMHSSTILNFIEERKYVDKVSNFQVDHYELNREQNSVDLLQENVDTINSKTARSLFTSYIKQSTDTHLYDHDIKIPGTTNCVQPDTAEFTNFEVCE